MAAPLAAPSALQRRNLERRAFLDLIRMANTLSPPVEIARQLVVVASHLSGCEAVAIRLKAGPGYPYAASLGFPEGFVPTRDDLCARDEGGHLLRDEHRRPRPACLCGQLLLGQLDRRQPCFTDRGSYVALSARTAGAEDQGAPPACRHALGYETVGLFPIRRDDVVYGLLQCNDRHPGRLRARTIDLMENLAATAAHLFQLAMA